MAGAHGLGVDWGDEEFSGASCMEQEAVSSVHWVSVCGCIMVENYRAGLGGCGSELITSRWSHAGANRSGET